jgi:hypothetical protein
MGCTQSQEQQRSEQPQEITASNIAQVEAARALAYVLREHKGNVSRILLRIACRQLPAKCDPFYVCYLFDTRNDETLTEIGRGEIIKNNPNPQWLHTVTTLYYFQLHQYVLIKVYDALKLDAKDSNSIALKESALVGYLKVSLGDIVGNTSMSNELLDSRDLPLRSTIEVVCEEIASSYDTIRIQFEYSGSKTLSNSFLRISKQVQQDRNTYVEVYRSSVVTEGTQTPQYLLESTTLDIANGDFNQPLKIELLQWGLTGEVSVGVLLPPPSLLFPSFLIP